ncbi:hypothetical protein, partial [Vreelandella neptunia]
HRISKRPHELPDQIVKERFRCVVAVKATGLPLNWRASARKAYSTHFLVFVNRRFQRGKRAMNLR